MITHSILLPNAQYHPLQGLPPVPAYTIETIAHQLAQINRFTGAACRPYSVAEHSLLCADIADDLGLSAHAQLACLMHDAHECITGDMASPVKWTIGGVWDNFERNHANQLRRHFGICSTFASHRQQIKAIDLIALATERRDLMPFEHATCDPWPILDTPGHEVAPYQVDLRTLKRENEHWTEWRNEFLQRYHELSEHAAAATSITTTTAD